MNKKFLSSLQVVNASIDFVSINFVFFSCYFFIVSRVPISTDPQYLYFGFALSSLWLAVVLFTGLYSEKNILSFESFTRATAKAYIYLLLFICLYLFFLKITFLSRMFLGLVLGLIPMFLLLNRFLYVSALQYLKGRDYLVSKVMVIGYNNLSKRLVDYLESDMNNKEVVGYCDEFENVQELSTHPILSNINGAMEICKNHGITEIYSTITPEQNTSIYSLIQTADYNCIRFKLVPDLGIFSNQKMHVDFVKEIPVLMQRNEPLEDVGNRLLKRLFDIAVSAMVILLVMSWLVPLLALLIKLESRGPVFFCQLRSGKDNKSFLCFKFRSMYVNKQADEKQATANDDRITTMGKFLRSTSLDEFPQFFNVLSGQMSIVGPRPHMLRHTDEYAQLIGKFMVRHFLKPGITGWAQVNGLRGETKDIGQMQQRVEHDLWYLENWSMYLDLRIIFLTAYNIIRGDKNAF